jgi:hypothetical protein
VAPAVAAHNVRAKSNGGGGSSDGESSSAGGGGRRRRCPQTAAAQEGSADVPQTRRDVVWANAFILLAYDSKIDDACCVDTRMRKTLLRIIFRHCSSYISMELTYL